MEKQSIKTPNRELRSSVKRLLISLALVFTACTQSPTPQYEQTISTVTPTPKEVILLPTLTVSGNLSSKLNNEVLDEIKDTYIEYVNDYTCPSIITIENADLSARSTYDENKKIKEVVLGEGEPGKIRVDLAEISRNRSTEGMREKLRFVLIHEFLHSCKLDKNIRFTPEIKLSDKTTIYRAYGLRLGMKKSDGTLLDTYGLFEEAVADSLGRKFDAGYVSYSYKYEYIGELVTNAIKEGWVTPKQLAQMVYQYNIWDFVRVFSGIKDPKAKDIEELMKNFNTAWNEDPDLAWLQIKSIRKGNFK